MNILVIGCGKVGSRLALELDKQGHDVAIVDKDEKQFDCLSSDFTGFKQTGVPIDQDILKKAGIENCDAVAAVTQDDNINIMTSQLAREFFNVPIVITRIYDPKREDVYSHFGLHTICPTNMTVDAVCAAITKADQIRNITFGTSTLSFITRNVTENVIGVDMNSKNVPKEFPEDIFFALLKDNNYLILKDTEKCIITKNDKLIFVKKVD